jgi:hypothetical protein
MLSSMTCTLGPKNVRKNIMVEPGSIAARLRLGVLTWNVKDFSRWNRMLPAARRVRVERPVGCGQ